MTLTAQSIPVLLIDQTTPQTVINGTTVFQEGLAIGVGLTAPSAFLHIKAGTAAASTAPLKLTQSGAVVLGTPEAGAIEVNNGDILYYTIKTGPTRKIIAFTDSTMTGPLVAGAATSGLTLKQGANGKCGTFVANGAVAVSVANTSIAITDTVCMSLNTVGGTISRAPFLQTITAGVGFTVAAGNTDTSTYNYAIISNAT